MPDRISIPALREQFERIAPDLAVIVGAKEILALVEAVEAARQVEDDARRQGLDWIAASLARALARFDFGEDGHPEAARNAPWAEA